MTTATCRVTFGRGPAGDSPHYLIELDDELNRDADGNAKSQFAAGETIWLRLHVQPGYVPALLYQTDGMLTAAGVVTRSRRQEGAFWSFEAPAVDLDCYPAGPVAIDWQGNIIDLLPIEGRTLTAAQGENLDRIARAILTYPVQYYLFRYDPPAGLTLADGESYQIDAMITLEALP